MREYQIFADSACDIPESLQISHGIHLVPFYVSFQQDTYYKELTDISNEEFYQKLSVKNVFSITSLPSVQDYISGFREALKNGYDVLCICLSHKLSGSYQAAVNAKYILEEQFPDAEIQIIDSLQATAGEGLLLLQAAYMKEAGLPLAEVVAKLNLQSSTTGIMFTLNTLDYLAKGKRIGKVESLASNMLDLKPLIRMKDGELIPYSNVRGRRKALEQIFSMMIDYFDETGENPSDYDFVIANATTMDDAHYLKNRVEEFLGRKIMNPIFQIGVTIGTYTGPGAIGICFTKQFDRI